MELVTRVKRVLALTVLKAYDVCEASRLLVLEAKCCVVGEPSSSRRDFPANARMLLRQAWASLTTSTTWDERQLADADGYYDGLKAAYQPAPAVAASPVLLAVWKDGWARGDHQRRASEAVRESASA